MWSVHTPHETCTGPSRCTVAYHILTRKKNDIVFLHVVFSFFLSPFRPPRILSRLADLSSFSKSFPPPQNFALCLFFRVVGERENREKHVSLFRLWRENLGGRQLSLNREKEGRKEGDAFGQVKTLICGVYVQQQSWADCLSSSYFNESAFARALPSPSSAHRS